MLELVQVDHLSGDTGCNVCNIIPLGSVNQGHQQLGNTSSVSRVPGHGLAQRVFKYS